MRLNITIVTSYDSLIVILVPKFFIIKASKSTEETRPKRHKNKTWICHINCEVFTLYNI